MTTGSDSDSARSPATLIGLIASVIGILAFFGITNWQELKDFISSGSSHSSPGAVEKVAVGDCISIELSIMNSGEASDFRPDACEPTVERGTYKVLGILPYDRGAYAWGGKTRPPTEIGNEIGTCGLGMGWDKSTSFNAFSIYTAKGREVVCIQLLTD